MESTKQALANLLTVINRNEGRLETVREDLENYSLKLEAAEDELVVVTEVMQIMKALDEEWHTTFEDRVCQLISRGLSLVFNEPLEFIIESKLSGELQVIELKLRQEIEEGKHLTTDIIGAKGGGVVGVVGFLLRVIILLSIKPKLRDFMVLDETFSHLSAEYVENMATLLRQLADETGIQILLITHDPVFEIHADMYYRVTQEFGESKYTQIRDKQERVIST